MENIKKLKEILSRYKTPEEIESIISKIERINVLKKEKDVVILGHNYMPPEIYYGISDFTGDSLALAQKAVDTQAKIILFCGVNFMAETAKILNPEKKVIIPSLDAGCSLAESITPEVIRDFKEKNPGVPVVTYINTSAAVKAECDVVCTSANAVKVIESLDSDTVFFIPDVYLAGNAQKQTKKKIIAWNGKCMVHELFSPTDIAMARKSFPGVEVIAHPECPPEVISASDYAGSTTQIEKYIESNKPAKILLLTECSMGENIKSIHPEIDFVSSCQICPHMHKISLENVLESLEKEIFEINVDENIRKKAVHSLNRMLEIGR